MRLRQARAHPETRTLPELMGEMAKWHLMLHPKFMECHTEPEVWEECVRALAGAYLEDQEKSCIKYEFGTIPPRPWLRLLLLFFEPNWSGCRPLCRRWTIH